MLHSIGELVDRLVIENIKIFNVRQQLHAADLSDDNYNALYNKMMVLNNNRNLIGATLDDKIGNVVKGKEKNVVLKTVRTI